MKYGCEPIVKFSLTVSFVWLGWGLYGALAAFGIALCLTIVLAYIPLRRYLSSGCPSFQHRAFHEKVVRFTAPLIGALIVASLATRSDVFMIGYWLPPEQVGFYGAAFQTASIIALILGSLDSVATPLISRAIADDNKRSGLQPLLQSVLRWSVTISFPVFLVFVLFPAEVLSIFGDQFQHASYCLVVLAMSQVINAASGSSNTALVLAGYSKMVMWNSIWLGVVQIVFNVLRPSYGMSGAAVGTATALTLVSLVRFYECSLLLKVKMIEREIWKPVAAAAITYALIYASKSSGLPVSWWMLAVTSVGIYVLIITLLGLHEEDRKILNHLKETVYRYRGPRLCA